MDKLSVVEGDQCVPVPPTLDRTAWHKPLCTVIITHHNYSHLIEDAILSLLDQTYNTWECVIVDDCSTKDELQRLGAIVEKLSDRRIRLIQNVEQLGQTGSFFAGLAETTGEFVSLLDPDDRLTPTYLDEMTKAHLNDSFFCPVVSCDQMMLRLGGTLLTGTWKGQSEALRRRDLFPMNLKRPDCSSLRYYPYWSRGWLWSASTGIMYRRSALNFLRPNKRLSYKTCADNYLARGTHYLGGTLFLAKPLFYRGVHTSNDFLAEIIFSMNQRTQKVEVRKDNLQRKLDIVEALFHNGVMQWFSESHLRNVLRRHFDKNEMVMIAKTCPEAYRLWHSSRGIHRRALKHVRRALFGT